MEDVVDPLDIVKVLLLLICGCAAPEPISYRLITVQDDHCVKAPDDIPCCKEMWLGGEPYNDFYHYKDGSWEACRDEQRMEPIVSTE